MKNKSAVLRTQPRHYGPSRTSFLSGGGLSLSPPPLPDKAALFLSRYATGTLPETLHPGARFLRACPPVYFVVRPIKGHLWLGLIFSRAPGKGFGGQVLRWLCRLADECGVSLHLIVGRPARLGPPYPNDTALADWYRRHGFVASGRDNGRLIMVRRSGG